MTTSRVYASYQEIIDLNTESDRVSILGFHTPANSQPIRLLQPFWEAYQKVKYLGCSMSLVPAARLPADPMGVSYEGGELQIDPRDLLNPILFHGCHGNDMGTILNQFYSGEASGTTEIERRMSDSVDLNKVKTTYEGNTPIYETLYYRALTDNTWLKAHPMRGFRKSMRPMVYTLASNTPLNPNNGGFTVRGGLVTKEQAWDAYDGVDEGDDRVVGGYSAIGSGTTTNTSFQSTAAPGLQTTNITLNSDTGKWNANWQNPGTFSGQFFMSPRLQRLGWIDTRQWVSGAGTSSVLNGQVSSPTDATFAQKLASNYLSDDSRYCTIPKLFMGMCLLPPAYKTEQYFRIVLNHKFAFAKYRGTSMRDNGQMLAAIGNVVNMYSSSSKAVPEKEVIDNGADDKGVLDD